MDHDSRFMDKLIADTKKNGGTVTATYTKLATATHTTAATGNTAIAKAAIAERKTPDDGTSKTVDENIAKAKEHVKQVENYNPDFSKPVEKPVTNDPKVLKEYEEKVTARDALHNLKTGIIKTDREDKKDLLARTGVVYNEASKQFINTKKDSIMYQKIWIIGKTF